MEVAAGHTETPFKNGSNPRVPISKIAIWDLCSAHDNRLLYNSQVLQQPIDAPLQPNGWKPWAVLSRRTSPASYWLLLLLCSRQSGSRRSHQGDRCGCGWNSFTRVQQMLRCARRSAHCSAARHPDTRRYRSVLALCPSALSRDTSTLARLYIVYDKHTRFTPTRLQVYRNAEYFELCDWHLFWCHSTVPATMSQLLKRVALGVTRLFDNDAAFGCRTGQAARSLNSICNSVFGAKCIWSELSET